MKKFTVVSQTPERKLVGFLAQGGALYFKDKEGNIRALEKNKICYSLHFSLEDVRQHLQGTPIYEGDVVQIQF